MSYINVTTEVDLSGKPRPQLADLGEDFKLHLSVSFADPWLLQTDAISVGWRITKVGTPGWQTVRKASFSLGSRVYNCSQILGAIAFHARLPRPDKYVFSAEVWEE